MRTEQLCEIRGQLLSGDSGKVKLLFFDVPSWAKSLSVSFEYSPLFLADEARNRLLVEQAVRTYIEEEKDPGLFGKYMESPAIKPNLKTIRNLLNLIFHDGEGNFRGRWDYTGRKGDLNAIGEKSTRGFMRMPLKPGRWMIELEAFGVFTPFCDFLIEVTGFEEEPSDAPGAQPAPELRLPGARSGWIKGELHSHTTHSDGTLPLRQLADKAAEHGLDFLAVTDHNTVSHIQEMEEMGWPGLVGGYELTTFKGHFIAYGVKTFIPWHMAERMADMNEAADTVHDNLGLFSLVHPFSIGEPVCVGCPLRIENLDFGKIDMMEIWSGSWDARFPEIKRTIRLWDRLLAEGRRITGVTGTDWHGSVERGRYDGRNPMTCVLVEEPSAAEILQAIKAARVYISTKPQIDFTVSWSRGEAQIGDRVRLLPGEKYSINVSLRGADQECELRLLNWGKTKEARSTQSSRSFVFDGAFESPAMLRAELWNPAEGRLVLITNHIEFMAA